MTQKIKTDKIFFAKFGILIISLLLYQSSILAKNHEIIVASNSFTPSSLVIEAGDTVTWHNTGGGHNVKATDGSFRCSQGCDAFGGDGNPSFNLWSFTLTFRKLGTVNYFCEPHLAFGMQGSITVIEPQNSTIHEIHATANNDFQPDNLTIMRGDVVKFINDGGSHNIHTVDNSLICSQACVGDNIDTETQATGFPFTTYVRFNQIAEIPYYCEQHEFSGTGGTIHVLTDTLFANSFEN